MSTPRPVIGLDPGAVTALARVFDGKLTNLESYRWPKQLVELLDALRHYSQGAVVVVETPQPGSPRRRTRSVGECAAKAKTLADYAAACQAYRVIVRGPIPGMTKLDARRWQCYFPEWPGETNNHERDAAVLAKFGGGS